MPAAAMAQTAPGTVTAAVPDVQLSPGQLSFWAAVLVTAVAVTVHLLRRHPVLPSPATVSAQSRSTESELAEPDRAFWNAFAGAVVIFPALVIPSLASPPAGLLLLLLGTATAICVLFAGRSLDIRRSRQAGYDDAAALHRELEWRWSRYEIDPGQTILYPAMTDVRVPETARLVRALRDAADSRSTVAADYPAAVERLSRALREAERTAGVPDQP